MSIQTEHRPESFDQVIGQQPIVKSIQAAIKRKAGRAYLLTGPSGVGKTTIARIAAKQLGCPVPIEEDAAKNTGIENMREIIEGLMYRPIGEGAVKAIIIDECHMLSKNAVTSLLKSLEDPPSHVYWFLCTTDPAKIPVAIKGRCLSYQLKPVSIDDLMDLLEGTDDGKNVDEAILTLCAKKADGSPRQALANLGVCLAAKDKREAAELLEDYEESPQAIDLARMLNDQRASWNEVAGLLKEMKDVNPESVRHVVRAYMTTVVLSSGSKLALRTLEAFSQPFSSSDGNSPLVIACGKLFLR